MVTPDIQIDRRIIQEARVLTSQGHEVILIAMYSDGHPFYEWIGPIKVERIDPLNQDSSLIVQLLLDSRKLVVDLLESYSFKAETNNWRISNTLIQFVTSLVNSLSGLGIKLISKLRGLNPSEMTIKNRILFYEPDIIHIHDLPYLKSGVVAKGILKNKIIYDAHEIYPEIYSLTPIQKRHLSNLEKKLIKKCDVVITVNPFIADVMSERYNIKSPEIILNAIEIPRDFPYQNNNDFLKEFFHIPKEHKILLFQGWLSGERGLITLLNAIKRLPENIHLIYMGYGNIQTELVKITNDNNLKGRFHIKDTIPQDELLYWTASADAGIIPYQPIDINHIYCSPNKLYEYIEAGLPIIANDLPYLTQVVKDEGFGVVHKLSCEDDFIAAILEMFDEHLGGPTRFKDALSRKRHIYSWDLQAKKLLEIYKPFDNSHN